MLTTLWLAGQVQLTDHPVVAVVAVLVTVTVAVNPPFHWLSMCMLAEQPAPPPPEGMVVAVTALDGCERFPAASRARTVYVYCVEGARPVSVKDVPAGVATLVPLRNT